LAELKRREPISRFAVRSTRHRMRIDEIPHASIAIGLLTIAACPSSPPSFPPSEQTDVTGVDRTTGSSSDDAPASTTTSETTEPRADTTSPGSESTSSIEPDTTSNATTTGGPNDAWWSACPMGTDEECLLPGEICITLATVVGIQASWCGVNPCGDPSECPPSPIPGTAPFCAPPSGGTCALACIDEMPCPDGMTCSTATFMGGRPFSICTWPNN
jgi:hypothetical protein